MDELTLCTWENPKRVLLQTVKTLMKRIVLLHLSGKVYTVCQGKNIFLQNNIMFLIITCHPLDIYNGLTQVDGSDQKE